MGTVVLIIGRSGSGKSSSMRNLDLSKVGLFNVASKPLPFKGQARNKVDRPTYEIIEKTLVANKLKNYVIDDAGFLMGFECFARAKETGYQKFTEMASNFYNLIQTAIQKTSHDTIVYFTMHTDTDEYGRRAKSYGKMLDSQLGSIEGLFSIVIEAVNEQGEYKFIVHGDGTSTVKTPIGMFEEDVIDNDLKLVEEAIRKYY